MGTGACTGYGYGCMYRVWVQVHVQGMGAKMAKVAKLAKYGEPITWVSQNCHFWHKTPKIHLKYS